MDELIRDFGMEVIDMSLWDGHIDLVISAASAELAWVGQEGFIDFLKGLN